MAIAIAASATPQAAARRAASGRRFAARLGALSPDRAQNISGMPASECRAR
jgi:hypothetical protein